MALSTKHVELTRCASNGELHGWIMVGHTHAGAPIKPDSFLSLGQWIISLNLFKFQWALTDDLCLQQRGAEQRRDTHRKRRTCSSWNAKLPTIVVPIISSPGHAEIPIYWSYSVSHFPFTRSGGVSHHWVMEFSHCSPRTINAMKCQFEINFEKKQFKIQPNHLGG